MPCEIRPAYIVNLLLGDASLSAQLIDIRHAGVAVSDVREELLVVLVQEQPLGTLKDRIFALADASRVHFFREVAADFNELLTRFRFVERSSRINQIKETKRADKRHGSCGIGFHETIVRSKNVPELKITMGDLWNGGNRLESQLAEICDKYARFRIVC
jgi:hypothetical protein